MLCRTCFQRVSWAADEELPNSIQDIPIYFSQLKGKEAERRVNSPLYGGEILIQKILGVLQHQIRFTCLDGRVANVHDAARTGGTCTGQYLEQEQEIKGKDGNDC